MGKSGVLDDIDILSPRNFAVGRVEYVFGYDESNWPVHEQLQEIQEDRIVYVDTFGCGNKAVFGDLVAKYIRLYKQARGMVVNGLVRDSHTLIKEEYPIWCKGVTPLGCYNRDVPLSDETREAAARERERFQSGVMVCDDSGCTLITKEQLNEELLSGLKWIELQEDIWFYCIDTLKWSTFKTVCLKDYLNDPSVLPEILRDRLAAKKLD